MAKVLGSLQVVLTATAEKMTAGLLAARSSLKTFEGAVETTAGKIATLTGALGAGLSVAGLTAATRAQLQSVDAAAKLSDRLGIATERLIGLQHAADLSGASSELLATSLQKMQVNLGKAAADGGPAADAFKKIGLSAAELATMETDEAFYRIADAIKAIQNPYERTAAAVAIFGKGAGDLLPTLLQGSEALREQAAETIAFGTAISRVDAAQIEAANDAMTRVKQAVLGVGTQIAATLAPAIESASKRFVELATAGGGIGRVIGTAIGYAVGAFAKIIEVVAEWGTQIRDSIVVVLALVAALRIWRAAQQAIAAGQAILLALSGPKGWATLAAGAVIAAGAVWGVREAFAAVEQAAEAGAKAGAAFAAMPQAGDFAAIDRMAEVQQRAKQVVEENRTASEQFGAKLGELIKLYEAGAISAETYDRALAKLRDERPGNDVVKSLREEIDALKFGADAAELMRLKQAGATKATLDQIAALQQQRSAVKAQIEYEKFLKDNAAKEREKIRDDAAKGIADAKKSGMAAAEARNTAVVGGSSDYFAALHQGDRNAVAKSSIAERTLEIQAESKRLLSEIARKEPVLLNVVAEGQL